MLSDELILPFMELKLEPVIAAALDRRLESIACVIPAAVAMLATRSASGVPQIVQMARSRTPGQVASKWGPGVFYGDALVYMSRAAYHLRRGYAVSCWSELIPLTLQNLLCFTLLRHSRASARADDEDYAGSKLLPRPWARRIGKWFKLSLDVVLLATLSGLMFFLPQRMLPLLCLWSVPLSVMSYGLQVLEVARMGASPSGNRATAVKLRWFGSLVRVLTTARFLGGDRTAMANHFVGFVGCSVLLLQRALFVRHGPSKVQTRRALYAQLLGKREPPAARALPRAIDATLHAWRSLGGFGAAAPPSTADVLRHRRAFDAIDEDGNGSLSAEDITSALLRAGAANGAAGNMSRTDAKELVESMMLLADADGNGCVVRARQRPNGH